MCIWCLVIASTASKYYMIGPRLIEWVIMYVFRKNRFYNAFDRNFMGKRIEEDGYSIKKGC